MTDPMPATRLAEIDAVTTAAAKGPWLHVDGWTVTGPEEDGLSTLLVSIDCGDPADGAFIAMARTAVPELIAEVRRLTPPPPRAITAVRVKETPGGYWRVRYRLRGKSATVQGFLSKTDADEWVDQLRAKYESAPAGPAKGGAE